MKDKTPTNPPPSPKLGNPMDAAEGKMLLESQEVKDKATDKSNPPKADWVGRFPMELPGMKEELERQAREIRERNQGRPPVRENWPE